VFLENTHRGDQEDRPNHHEYATTATASTVTPNMTPEELVNFMDVAVASKYGNDLSNFTRVITDDVHSTLESFKTDLQNTLHRQIRSVAQQVQGEAQGKQPDLAHSTPYTVAPGKMGVLGNTSTTHLGSTSDNVIYVDASSPYLGSTSMGNPGVFPTASIPYPGVHPLRLTWVFLHTTHNRTRV
jgi:hypothetical protein